MPNASLAARGLARLRGRDRGAKGGEKGYQAEGDASNTHDQKYWGKDSSMAGGLRGMPLVLASLYVGKRAAPYTSRRAAVRLASAR